MESLILTLGWVGIYAPLGLGAMGSTIGCSLAGQAAVGALLETEGAYGRYIGVSAMPSSQTVYGIVTMLTLGRDLTLNSAPGIFAIGILFGFLLLFSGIYQGKACASAIQASKDKPQIFGISLAPAAIVEGFAVFGFVFALILVGKL